VWLQDRAQRRIDNSSHPAKMLGFEGLQYSSMIYDFGNGSKHLETLKTPELDWMV
jgi:hypothetical protein